MTKKLLIETLKEGEKYYNISDVYSLEEETYIEVEGEMVLTPSYKLNRVKEEVGYDVVLNDYINLSAKIDALDSKTSDRLEEITELEAEIEELRVLQDEEVKEFNALSEKLDEKEKSGFIREEDWIKKEEEDEELEEDESEE